MKLLLLTPQLPWPARQGTAIRNFSLIEQLASRHTIDLLSFVAADELLTHDNPLHTLCRRIATVPQPQRTTATRVRDTLLSRQPDMALRLASDEMDALIYQWMSAQWTARDSHDRDSHDHGSYDIVQAEGIEMARFGLLAQTVATRHNSRTALIFDDHNCEYLLQKRNALTDLRTPRRLPAALYSMVQWQKLRRYEAHVCRRADGVLAVSSADAHALRALVPEKPVTVISNGIDLDAITAAEAQEPPAPILLFTGKMDYRPNIDAVIWFASEVLPLILQKRPDARFQIVGRSPHARLDSLRGQPGIEITGAVEDVRPYMAQAGVYVIPLRVGGGTRFKALEAMASARPIVSTTLGVEGIGIEHGREMLLADTPSAFAEAVLTLLAPENSTLRAALKAEARRLVERDYGWQEIVPRLEEVYQQF